MAGGWRLVRPSKALALAAINTVSETLRIGVPSLAPLSEARGRIAVLAAATGPWPPYPRVELDGCGVRAGSAGRGSRLRIAGRVRPYSGPLTIADPDRECVWTDTGAPLPIGANAVAPKEILSVEDGTAVLNGEIEPWKAISLPASDVATGDPILVPGRLATPESVAAAASLGFRGLPVDTSRVRVCVASIGDELVEPWEEGAVRDSNRYQVAARLQRLGVEVVDLGIVGDDASEVIAIIDEASRRGCRALVTSGGTSVGLSDPVPAAVREEGVILVHGLRMRPGRPTLVGIARGLLVVGLPGNPRSSGSVAENFLLPLLTMLSLAYGGRGYVEATLAYTVENKGERPAHLPVALLKGRSGLLAVPVARESFMVLSWPLASATLELQPGARVDAGSTVEVYVYADTYKAAVDAADSGLTSVDGLPLVKTPLGPESQEASETARDLGIPVIRVAASTSTRTLYARSLVAAPGGGGAGLYSVECAAPRGYDDLCLDGETLEAPRIESARLLAEQGYSAAYAGPLNPWERPAGRVRGVEYLELIK